jgi:hypothetical protein
MKMNLFNALVLSSFLSLPMAAHAASSYHCVFSEGQHSYTINIYNPAGTWGPNLVTIMNEAKQVETFLGSELQLRPVEGIDIKAKKQGAELNVAIN